MSAQFCVQFPPSIEFLIACRVIQAIGASVLEAVSLAIILAVFSKDKRTAAIGIWGALAGLAAAAGPVLGGFLLELGKGKSGVAMDFLCKCTVLSGRVSDDCPQRTGNPRSPGRQAN